MNIASCFNSPKYFTNGFIFYTSSLEYISKDKFIFTLKNIYRILKLGYSGTTNNIRFWKVLPLYRKQLAKEFYI